MKKGTYFHSEETKQEIRKRLHTKEVQQLLRRSRGMASSDTCEKLSQGMMGKNKGKPAGNKGKKCPIGCTCGHHTGRSGEYPRTFNRALKVKIFTRDNYTCQLCGRHEKLVPHHIDYDKENNDETNLITLCNSCNVKVNSERISWFVFFELKMTKVRF